MLYDVEHPGDRRHRHILIDPDSRPDLAGETREWLDYVLDVDGDPESSDQQDAQRPDGCAGCTYLPGPDTGVRVATDPTCPIHSTTRE